MGDCLGGGGQGPPSPAYNTTGDKLGLHYGLVYWVLDIFDFKRNGILWRTGHLIQSEFRSFFTIHIHSDLMIAYFHTSR